MIHSNRTEYTLEQVAEANSPENAWIVIHGKVYNVSSYLDDHPGGRDVLLELAGGDATNDFDFVGHSKSASKAIAEFEVGDVAGFTVPAKREARQQLMEPETKPQKPERTVLSHFGNRTAARDWAPLFFLLITALYWALHEKTRLSELLNGAPLNLVLSLSLITAALMFSGRSYWHSLFHYRGVFEYPPHYTVL
ncbi:Cytochrome b5 [Cordyceps militaris CM01]|uniref:Cytochrome b5 n=1 Tax=Cordyceps militaris (strain CM01) TaxID=983644 RepID=G3J538_CORMM|nr:Cytochrome b5 [Cordyceps militaris CM01]EGX95952.1 Cytochrome b5 [Cordyceps militaris CM01]